MSILSFRVYYKNRETREGIVLNWIIQLTFINNTKSSLVWWFKRADCISSFSGTYSQNNDLVVIFAIIQYGTYICNAVGWWGEWVIKWVSLFRRPSFYTSCRRTWWVKRGDLVVNGVKCRTHCANTSKQKLHQTVMYPHQVGLPSRSLNNYWFYF